MYAFVALYPSIKGWQYCKPFVVIDGTFLKSAYRGTLLIASTQDPPGNILPLAYAIVDSENNASWEWFFAIFKDAFREREGICIVSGRHEGIENAAATLYTQVPHCVCIWHLWNNVKTNYKKNHLLLKDIFFAMAKAYTVEKFDYHMAEVEKIDKRVKDYLMNVGYERWSRARSTVNRTLTMTSNIAESINAALKAARELPVTPTTSYLYSVLDKGKQRMVFLKDRTCTCRRFQLDELPCAHAWAVLKYKYIDHIEYCSVYYTTKYLLKTYEIPIYPVPDESTWEIPAKVLNEKVLPPDMTKTIGRPRKGRCKPISERERKRSISCGQCGEEGHNRKT
ncbi:PREDICTED: uncharacterized protein LOC109211506 [Nicotiana attenuata]|uniref:uncharacterized protein LOC109211506 n=1 Tax=Nicotiana attenuata TaxID=49451 RepID=UPI00090511A7|nr:PREDICTED: uncharacterized protein LOC109211506 [Nicotiana attenuata]